MAPLESKRKSTKLIWLKISCNQIFSAYTKTFCSYFDLSIETVHSKMKKLLFLIYFSTISTFLFAQQGSIQGRVFNPVNNEPIPFANIIIQGLDIGTVTDEQGFYQLGGITPGLYNVRASFVGFKPKNYF